MKCSVGCVPLPILVHQRLVKYSLYGSQSQQPTYQPYTVAMVTAVQWMLNT